MEQERIQQLLGEKFNCAQTMMIMGMEAIETENPEAVRAMTGLGGGLGGCGKACGALTGAVSMLGLFAGRGTVEEDADERLQPMVQELVAWFEENFGAPGQGVDCAGIIGGDKRNIQTICPNLIVQTCAKAFELLEDNGFL